jgi:flagellar biosynthesis protein FlhF
MHEALDRLADRDLILIDTAGLSPRDKTKMRELRSLLTAAAPDEIHLVQSSVASAASLLHSNEQFSALGATALLLTKLDEATSLGNLLPLVRGGLPISYLTDGQRVPDDLRPAEAGRLARALLGMPPVGSKVPTPPDSVYEPRTKSPVCSRKP